MKKCISKAFGKKVYLLGIDSEGTAYWLEEATWDCDWYWSFGYIETYTNNRHPNRARDIESHQHFDSMFLNGNKMAKDLFDDFFTETPLTNSEKWQLIELMATFYKMKEYSNLIHTGGSNYTENILSNDIKNDNEFERINKILLPKLFSKIYKILGENKEEE